MPLQEWSDRNLVTNSVSSLFVNWCALSNPSIDRCERNTSQFSHPALVHNIRSIVRILPPAVKFLEIPTKIKLVLFVGLVRVRHFSKFQSSHYEITTLTQF